jgi:hypothetical protein
MYYLYVMLFLFMYGKLGNQVSYFILFLPGLRNCVCRAIGEAVSGRPATAELAHIPGRFSV